MTVLQAHLEWNVADTNTAFKSAAQGTQKQMAEQSLLGIYIVNISPGTISVLQILLMLDNKKAVVQQQVFISLWIHGQIFQMNAIIKINRNFQILVIALGSFFYISSEI